MTVHGSDASEELRREGPMLADETRDIRKKAVDNDDLAYFRTGQKPGDTPRPYITAEEVDELFSSDDELVSGTGVDPSDPFQPPTSAQKKLQDGLDALTATGQDAEEPPRKKRRTRRPKDPSAPKKPPNAYFRYRDQELVRLKAQYGNVSGTAITRMISEHWSCLPAEEKQPFYDAYNREYTEYRSLAAAGQLGGGGGPSSQAVAEGDMAHPNSQDNGATVPSPPPDEEGHTEVVDTEHPGEEEGELALDDQHEG
ncbi:hypothetical protein IWQ60_006287 [Tieghemiomyces parasiticus]|uniref:HMG box domain-containing protein n=1 Tax=Tieghemiomyces parasiticus TaxID=78921 RepID=A0A9W8A5B3_9FUNG|nr:hypothetical protein IWQ60_006287 [Tieghemiomyces parasiticus]